jgi:hypothetical protein
MIAVARGSSYSQLECAVCHQPLKPGDRILQSFKHGVPKVMHANACRCPRPVQKHPAV